MLVSCLTYSCTLKREAIFSSETSVDFQQTTLRYIPEDRTLYNHRWENLKRYFYFLTGKSDLRLVAAQERSGENVYYILRTIQTDSLPPFTMLSQIAGQLKCVRHFQSQIYLARDSVLRSCSLNRQHFSEFQQLGVYTGCTNFNGGIKHAAA
jgi:hypothetical protein